MSTGIHSPIKDSHSRPITAGGFVDDSPVIFVDRRYRPAMFSTNVMQGQLVTTAIFFFPKKTASGDPTIALDEKSVEFNCKIEGQPRRVNFEPQKMVDSKGLDL